MVMQLDADIRAYLESVASSPRPSDNPAGIEAMRQATHLAWSSGPGPDRAALVKDYFATGHGVQVPLRLYRPPAAEGPLPLILFMHGGGFVFGSVDTHNDIGHRLATEAGSAVLSVDYRLAPEHPFPAAVQDSWTALNWALTNAERIGIDPDRIVVHGDSAGGNLAAVTALQARDAGISLAGQALIYPVTDLREVEYESRLTRAEGFGLTSEDMRWYGGNYLGDPARADDPLASPMLAADLAGLPATFLMTSGFDPLCSEGQAYGERLRQAGVAVEHLHLPGANHGVYSNWRTFRSGEAVWQLLLAWLQPVLKVS